MIIPTLLAIPLTVLSPEAQAQPAPVPPPPGAIVLFSGKGDELTTHWRKRAADEPGHWPVADGAMTVRNGDIMTRQEFRDFYLHVEFRTPDMPDKTGQAKGNSGIGLLQRYEIQVLDSYGIEEPGKGDCGAVYGQAAPLVNACKPAMVWQTFDIIFRAPRLDENGNVVEKPRVTVLQNGIVIQNNVEIDGPTGIQWQTDRAPAATGRIVLQDHHNPVQYRNIWIVPLPEKGSDKY